MLLTEIPNYIKCKKICNLNNISFNKVYTNSSNVTKSSVFIIEKKTKLKNKYIKEAIKNGAVAIISNEFISNLSIKITNPISSDLNVMRPSTFPNLLSVINTNISKLYMTGKLFEVGPIFAASLEDNLCL